MADRSEPLLAGRLLYLSASLPESPEEADNAEEAILSLCRAVYAEGGTILANKSEELLTLVALVAGEYATVEPEEELEPSGPGWPEQPRPPARRRPAPLIVLPGERIVDGEDLAVLQRAGYLRQATPEERLGLLARADAMICVGRQRETDWHDFERASQRRRLVVAFPSTGAGAVDRATDFERESGPVEERFAAWFDDRRRLGPEDLPERDMDRFA